MEKCGNCNSTNLEYLPDVDGASWVGHTNKKTENGLSVLLVTYLLEKTKAQTM
jgi:hypothetical protein